MTSNFSEIKQKLPSLGIGFGLRREVAKQTFEHSNQIDWLEFVPENYMDIGGAARERLERARSEFPLVSHGINLSIGSTDDLNAEYLASMRKLLDEVDSPWWSDHLCFTSHNGVYMHDLLPLPFSAEAVNHVAERVRVAQDRVGRPFLLENISFYMQMPGREMNEAQFLSEVLEKADCGLLLDINNIYVNSLNHGFDPYEFLDQLPLERTVQIHMAGHTRMTDYVIDTHGAAVEEPVFALLKYVLQKTDVKAVMLERDQNFPEFSELLGELDQIRRIVEQTRPSALTTQRSSSRKSGAVLPWHEGSSKGREQVGVLSA